MSTTAHGLSKCREDHPCLMAPLLQLGLSSMSYKESFYCLQDQKATTSQSSMMPSPLYQIKEPFLRISVDPARKFLTPDQPLSTASNVPSSSTKPKAATKVTNATK